MPRPIASPTLAALVTVIALMVIAPACGGDDDGSGVQKDDASSAATDADVTVVATEPLDFDADQYTAPPGAITFAYDNGGSIVHTLVVEGREDDLRLEVRSSGDVDSGSIELEAGEYVLYCDVAGHRGGGMEATLTIE